ncbi:DUF4028 family protein [Bacillus manliponensis]|uniref:DUF4028 family protein n=1 Tax=Bacillus manliponensis TaxID=574376 RepID=UPI001F3212E0|nr:DUF4028 family protein [Bacillus manliponensis]
MRSNKKTEYLNNKERFTMIIKILKDKQDSSLCIIQDKEGERYEKSWRNEYDQFGTLISPTFKQVEEWKENERL